MHSYQHNIKTFNNATRHLTRVERSLYRDLIELYYDTENALTSDVQKLQRLVIAQNEQEKEALNYVLDEFFELTGDVYTHTFCDEVIEDYKSNTSKKAAAGRASAEARRLKAEALKAERGGVIKQDLTHVEQPLNKCATNQKPETINHKPNTTTTKDHSVWNWNPKQQILDQLIEQFQVPKKFVDEKLFAFKTYWSEREDMGGSYDAKFVNDIQRSWKKYKHEWIADNEQEESVNDEPAPITEIVDLYHEHLPELSPVKKITAARKDAIRRLWSGESGLPTKDDWANFFKYVHESQFLLGLSQPLPGRDRPFKADFDWIINETNAVKICEGKFHG